MKKNRGLILITVLWIMVILSALAIGMAKKIHFITVLTKNKIAFAKSLSSSESAVSYVLSILEKDTDFKTDTRKDDFYNNPKEFKEHEIEGSAKFSLIVKEEHEGNTNDRYGLDCQNGLLNINLLTSKQIEKITDDFDFEKTQIASVMDWIDSDNDPNNWGEGTEKDYYEELDVPYKTSNAPIESWAELYLIKGMTPEFAEFLKSNFTLYGDGKVNINYATSQTLKWMGLSDSVIEKVFHYFRGIDDISGTEDDQSFANLNTLYKDLNEFESLSPDESNEIQQILPLLTLTTSFFKANVHTYINNKLYPYKLVAIIKREEKVCTVLKEFEIFE